MQLLVVLQKDLMQRLTKQIKRPLVFDSNFFRLRKIRGDSTTNPDNEQSTSYTVRRQFTPVTSVSGSTNGEVTFNVQDNRIIYSGSELTELCCLLMQQW